MVDKYKILAVDNVSKKETSKEIEVIIRYENNIDEKESKSLQNLFQRLFDSYIAKAMQDIKKGK